MDYPPTMMPAPHCHTSRYWLGIVPYCECYTMEHLLGRKMSVRPKKRRSVNINW